MIHRPILFLYNRAINVYVKCNDIRIIVYERCITTNPVQKCEVIVDAGESGRMSDMHICIFCSNQASFAGLIELD